jgi:Mg/Co/Ni transporter MgtE
MTLLAMTEFARADLYRNESRRMVTQAICTALVQDPASNPRLLMELDPEGRADVMGYLTISQRAVAVAGMPFEDRMKTLHQMPGEHIGASLANLSATELLQTFKGFEVGNRPSVFADLDIAQRTAVLAWTPSKSRMDLLVKLRAPERAATLLSLPLKECCSTIRSMSPFHAECVLLEMSANSRGQVLLYLPERDLSAILIGMPVDKQVAALEGLEPKALYHAFRCIPAPAQSILFDELSLEDIAGLVSRMTAKERVTLVGSVPSALQGSVLRMLEPKDAAFVLRSVDKDKAAAALDELNAIEKAEIIKCLPGRDRGAILSRMEPYDRAGLISEIHNSEERMAFFRSLNVLEIANTLSEMAPEDILNALSDMTPSERAQVFSVMNPQDQTALALMMKPEVLASALAEMSIEDRKFLIRALPSEEKAAVLSYMPDAARAVLVKSIMPSEDFNPNPMRPAQDGEFLDTMRSLGPKALHSTLVEMSQRDKVSVLLLLPMRERARVLEYMSPLECADILDCFLLEDRANTICSIRLSHSLSIFTEMHIYKKAILLAAVGDLDRSSIMSAMTPHEIATILSAFPPADSVTTLRTLDAKKGAEALACMVPEERAITIEAIPTKDRATILSNMEPDHAALCLSRLHPEECAATIRLFKDETMRAVLNEMSNKPRAAALLACPIKFRVHALSMLHGAALAAFLEPLNQMELTTTVKSLAQPVMESAIPVLSLDAKVKVISCVAPNDAARLVELLSVRENGEVLIRLPPESCAGIFRNMNDDSIYATLTNLDRRDRENLLSRLPEILQMRISKIMIPPQPSPVLAPRHPTSDSDGVPQHLDSLNNPFEIVAYVGASPFVIPVKRPTALSPQSSVTRQQIPSASPQSSAAALDIPVIVSLKFDEDFDWLTADVQRKLSWSECLRGIVCNEVKASPQRIQVADLQQGSVCLLLRCLPLSETPELAQSDSRSAMQLALDLLTFTSDKQLSSKLPKFLGGTLHSLGDKEAMSRRRSLIPNLNGTPVVNIDRSMSPPTGKSPGHEICGVGIAFAPTQDGQYLSVIGMIPGGDADKSGLVNVGDVVNSIDGQDVKNIPIPKLAQRIRGPIGTHVQVGFKSLQGGSEKVIDLPRIQATSSPSREKNTDIPRIPATSSTALFPGSLSSERIPSSFIARPSSVSSDVRPQGPSTSVPVQLSYLSGQQAEARTQPDSKQDWQLFAVPNGTGDKGKSNSPGKSHSPKLFPGIPRMSPLFKPAEQVERPPSLSLEPSVAKHNIWGTLEQLDASIQRRNSDVRSFTESLLKLQGNSPSLSPKKGSNPTSAAFHYA